MLQDARGEPVSSPNAQALDLYERALRQFQSYVGDPVATIDTALAADPDFVLGHAFRATMLLLLTEAQYLPAIRASVEAAEALARKANERERGLTAAARRWLDGDWAGACQAWEAVLVEHPRDAFALQAAHITDFFVGDAKNLCDRVARVLPHWSADTPGYSYVLGMQAFGLEECNHYAKAEDTGRRALALEPKDGWAVHAVAHVMEMQGRFDEGIVWYAAREQDWAPDNGFAYHNWWHLALYHLERDDYARVLELYDTRIYARPASGLSLQMLDASALLWRLWLRGVDVGGRWAELAAHWQAKADGEIGYYAFNDIHALMAYIGAGRDQAAVALVGAMEKAAAGGDKQNARMARDVGLPVAGALLAFGQGRYDRAIELLAAVRDHAQRFGGSHAQRDLLTQTLIEAAFRAGRHKLARHLVNERIAYKPHSPFTRKLLLRVRHNNGDAPAATGAG